MRMLPISISMLDDCPTPGSSDVAMETGTNVGAFAPSSAEPLLIACRRQVNNCPRLTPWRRATSDTFAPGSKLSATMRAFSCALQVRRRAVPVITSTRRSSPGIVLCVKLALSLSSFLIASLRINRGAIIADSRQYCQCGRAITLTIILGHRSASMRRRSKARSPIASTLPLGQSESWNVSRRSSAASSCATRRRASPVGRPGRRRPSGKLAAAA